MADEKSTLSHQDRIDYLKLVKVGENLDEKSPAYVMALFVQFKEKQQPKDLALAWAHKNQHEFAPWYSIFPPGVKNDLDYISPAHLPFLQTIKEGKVPAGFTDPKDLYDHLTGVYQFRDERKTVIACIREKTKDFKEPQPLENQYTRFLYQYEDALRSMSPADAWEKAGKTFFSLR